MAIPLVGSPAPVVPALRDLITGDDQNFAATLGNWTNSGGTLTRDTSYKITGVNASLKYVATTSGQYVELPITGKFKANLDYWAVLFISMEETTGTHNFIMELGLIGTDTNQRTGSYNGAAVAPFVGNDRFVALAIKWRPTADRTGVKLRWALSNSVSTSWHIGNARCWQSPVLGRVEVAEDLYDPAGENEVAPGPPWASGRLSGVYTDVRGDVHVSNDNSTGGLDVLRSAIPGATYLWGEGAAGDISTEGVEIQVGDDYLGLYITEKDSDTVQIYADTGGGYMMQLRHRGSGKGWAVSDDGTVNGRIESYFQWVFRVSGTLTATTNVGEYFRTPNKAFIDEVQCHVGTAPTGQSILVDVNDDGTTVFTTQGNRPTIAAGTNDDTSGAADGGTAVAKDSVITIDVDQIGSGTAGADLTVHVRGRYIW